jgi:DNA repair exonuclease SbcCD nuclease subunit
MSVKLVWRTDVHISDRGPISRTDDWTETVLEKLTQVREIAKSKGAHGVIDGGDFFHEKSPKKCSHGLIRKIAELHKTYPCPVWANVGNHDCIRGDIANLHKQPLEVLFSTGVFLRNYDEHEAFFDVGGVTVRVVGVPYHGTTYDMDRLLNIERKGEDWLFVSCHLLASPAGGSMFGAEDIVSYKDLTRGTADLYAFGHSHADQGVRQICDDKYVINVGSLTRGSLSDDEIRRKPKVVSIEFTKNEIRLEEIELKIKDPADIFDLEGRVKEESRSLVVEQFVERISKSFSATNKSPLEDTVESLNVPAEVKERALQYLEES